MQDPSLQPDLVKYLKAQNPHYQEPQNKTKKPPPHAWMKNRAKPSGSQILNMSHTEELERRLEAVTLQPRAHPRIERPTPTLNPNLGRKAYNRERRNMMIQKRNTARRKREHEVLTEQHEPTGPQAELAVRPEEPVERLSKEEIENAENSVEDGSDDEMGGVML